MVSCNVQVVAEWEEDLGHFYSDLVLRYLRLLSR